MMDAKTFDIVKALMDTIELLLKDIEELHAENANLKTEVDWRENRRLCMNQQNKYHIEREILIRDAYAKIVPLIPKNGMYTWKHYDHGVLSGAWHEDASDYYMSVPEPLTNAMIAMQELISELYKDKK